MCVHYKEAGLWDNKPGSQTQNDKLTKAGNS